MATMTKLLILLLPLAVFGMPTVEENDLELVQSRAASCVCGMENKNAGDRISGGKEAVANRYPWMVRLDNMPGKDKYGRFSTGYVCGGSLISNRHVLTAYHCVDAWEEYHNKNYGKNKENVLVSAHDLHYGNYKKVKISSIEVPSVSEVGQHDIAIIVLASPVIFDDTIHPICLPESNEKVYKGERTRHLGWGMTGYKSSQSRFLKEVDLTVSDVSHRNKNHFYTDIVKVNGKLEDPCGGDSGGPLMHKNYINNQWTIIGTVNGGGYDCRTGRVNNGGKGVWNKVTAHLDWIMKVLYSTYGTTMCPRTSSGSSSSGSSGSSSSGSSGSSSSGSSGSSSACRYHDRFSSGYCSSAKSQCWSSEFVRKYCEKTCYCP